MKKKLVTYFQQTDPSPARTIAAGFALAQEWYNTVTGDKFYHKTDGVWTKYETSAAPAITQVTYTELVALIGSSSLVPDRTYLLTDYMTTWNDPVTDEPFSSGVPEPLYITATDTDKLSKECKSELYPQDIVYYEVTGDIANGEGTEGFTKGKIYRRIDTIYNNDIGTDWRHITYRRYAMKVENPWTIGNSYVVCDIVDNSGNIYICINDIVDSQSLDDGNWFLYPATNEEYLGIRDSGSSHIIFGNNIVIPVDIDNHQDLYLFDFVAYNTGVVYNNKIETYYLNNNVIRATYFYENSIGTEFKYNHIISNQFSNNNVNHAFSFNLIGSGVFYYNDFLSAFTYNIITDFTPFRVNTFDDEVYSNVYNGSMDGNKMSRMYYNYVTVFSDNIMSNTFHSNLLISPWTKNVCINGYVIGCKSSGDSVVVSYNLFTGSFDTNIIKLDFKYNRLSGFVHNNTFNGNFIANEHVGEEFIYNTFLGAAERNIIGTYFNQNTIGNIFTNNEIGSGFFNNIVGDYFTYNTIKADNVNWTFRNNTNHLTILNDINGSGRNIPYIPGTYDKTIRLSNGVLKCDYVDEHSDIIFQDDNTGPTFTFRSNREDLYIEVENKYFPISSAQAITPFIVDWGDIITPLVEDIPASEYFTRNHTYTGKLTTDSVEVSVIGDYIRYVSLEGNQITEFELNSNVSNYFEYLNLGDNLLTSFNPAIALPNSLTILNLYVNQLTSFDPSIALPNSLSSLALSDNLLTNFDPINHVLPSSLNTLYLSNNQITNFDPVNHPLPSSLIYLNLEGNQLTSFDPSIALPSGLVDLTLYNNQLTSFDPSIALPNSLSILTLSNNLLTSFNPTNHPLPSNLERLFIAANQLTSFNPSTPLPITIVEINLNLNQLDTTEVNNTLVMLNNRYTVSGQKYFSLQMNPPAPPTGVGLAAKASLMAKGYYVNTN
jgi:hypothetical protein